LFISSVNTKTARVIAGCAFITSDGTEWLITKNGRDGDDGFLITIDTNGNADPNMPQTVKNVAANGNKKKKDPNKQGDTKNRDRFFIYVDYDGKIHLPDDDTVVQSYLSSADMNREN